ncbi:carbon-nitrogen hydrolase family protein [Actinomadura hibisca]|uniref:carbon-nitrogen hydrolase family protein n=1 Tax=Actinomadura hibisca TaxID=68565 RepID=UPI000831E5CA|nr:carbon-nitrogen hydrolase family protein [Actinomadura hibisca]
MNDLRVVPGVPLTIAAGQAACAALDVAANAATAADLVRRAAERDADLLVLPELFLTGYEMETITADPARHTVTGDDARLDALATACADTRTAVMVGAPVHVPETGETHIGVLVLDRDGRVAASYAKQHVDSDERGAGFTAGPRGCTLTLDGWRLGVAICWDASFPEHARAAALDGCHAYLVSALFPRGRGERKRAVLGPARALDNALYVVAANHNGPSGSLYGCGNSAIWGPDGNLLADAGDADPGLAVARLDPKVLAEARSGDLPMADPSFTAPTRPRTEIAME